MERRSILYTYIGWWLIWVVIQSFLLWHAGFSWDIAITDALIMNVFLASEGYAMSYVLRFYQPANNNLHYLFIWSLGIATLVLLVWQWLIAWFFSDYTNYLVFVDQTLLFRYAFAWLMTSFSILLTWVWYRNTEKQELLERSNEIERLAKEAELYKLRLQLQPHFLFNSLNSINALTISKPEQARHMVQQLSDFLRGTLRKDDDQPVTLQEEFRHLQLYLDIEKVRFGYRLKTIFDYHERESNCTLPPLMLQPIVENAVKFGLYDTIGATTITIRAFQIESYLVINVINPFEGHDDYPNKGTGFGLDAIRRRLFLLYGRSDLLTIRTSPDQFITEIKIPQ